MLSLYVLAADVPVLALRCRERGYGNVDELVADAELTEKWLADLGVSTGPGRRMLLRELRRLKRAQSASPSVSEPDEPLHVDARWAAITTVPALSQPKSEPELVANSRKPIKSAAASFSGPPYLAMLTVRPSPGSEWPIPLDAVRLPTLLQSAQRRLAFAMHLVSRGSFGGGAVQVRRSPLEQLDLDVVELVGQLAVGEPAPIDRVLAAAGLDLDKTAIVERHLGLVGLMGSTFRLDALAAMCFNKDSRHGKHRGKWRSMVSELLLSSDIDGDGSRQVVRPSVLAMTTSITAGRHSTQARLRHLSEPEKLIETKLEHAVKALPTSIALREAASNGAVDELSRLIQSGVDLNSTDDTGCSALWLAAYHSHSRAVAVLIEASADIELPNEVGMTALMAAACCGSADTVRVLLQAGADWRKRDTDDGRTAIDWAKNTGTATDPDAVLLLQSWLLEHGTATEIEEFLNDALRQAVADGVLRTEVEVRRLVASGAQVDGVDSAGRCALHLAAGA